MKIVPCTLPWTNILIERKGVVRVCCNNPEVMGNLETHTIKEVWHSEKFTYLRDCVSKSDYSFGCLIWDCAYAKAQTKLKGKLDESGNSSNSNK